MRYARLKLTPPADGGFHPLGRALSEDPDIDRGAMHRIDTLADGSVVLLAEASGDLERYEEILEDSEHVYDYAVTGTDEWWYSYTHFEPNDVNRQMLARQRELELAMEMPIEVHDDGSFEVTLVGNEAAFEGAGTPLEGDWDLEILELGDRPPRAPDLAGALTPRQREVLETAVDMGYYESPRQATHAEIAEALDATPSTVGEHLQKIEARILPTLVE